MSPPGLKIRSRVFDHLHFSYSCVWFYSWHPGECSEDSIYIMPIGKYLLHYFPLKMYFIFFNIYNNSSRETKTSYGLTNKYGEVTADVVEMIMSIW